MYRVFNANVALVHEWIMKYFTGHMIGHMIIKEAWNLNVTRWLKEEAKSMNLSASENEVCCYNTTFIVFLPIFCVNNILYYIYLL